MDEIDRTIVNTLQGGFPVCERPFAAAAAVIGIAEQDLIDRVERLVEARTLSRFGPLFNTERLGGAVCLCALQVPADDFDRVADEVNAFPEVAHNYARDHAFNMWFVLATEDPDGIAETATRIERATGYTVYDFPKIDEFYVGLKLDA
ncbi:MAG TPA: AsnC family transcriptional regulator [Gammaproteobacteria bacterium]|jgi:DNA-binding Lrp family transcriptional regulator|nr:AsnC family transcriptional regulator [Gammaproteobacteria bacterium]